MPIHLRAHARDSLILALLSTTLVACNIGGGWGGDADTGTLTLGVADAPVDTAEKVVVQFTGVRIQQKDGLLLAIDYDSPKSIDLLKLQGGLRAYLLEHHTLLEGDYSWIRLMVNAEADGVCDSCITIDGADYELRIPSGGQSGLKLNTPFHVADGEDVDFTVDFDLRKSVHQPRGQTGPGGAPVYMLRPTLRLVDTHETGSISGTVDPAVFTGLTCSPGAAGYAVYVFEGASISPDDVDGNAPEPVNTAMARFSAGAYRYKAAFLEPGDYTAAATCMADQDEPDTDDDGVVSFVAPATVTVSAGSDTAHDF